MRQMLNIIKKYHKQFKLENTKSQKQKIISIFMLTLPHILTVFVFILLYPTKIIEISIIGLILPDFSYFFHGFIYPRSFFSKNSNLHMKREASKKITHILTFVVIIFLFLYGEYVLFLAGGIHLLLDLIGF